MSTEKDSNRLKKPLNSFFLFMKERRPIIRKEQPNKSMQEISKLLGQEWKSMSSDDKLKYKLAAIHLKKKYETKLAIYQKRKKIGLRKSKKDIRAKTKYFQTLKNIENDSLIFGEDLSQTLNVFDLILNITNCPSGYKISVTGLYCNQCPSGQFSVFKNSKQCYSCNDMHNAVTCLNGDNVIIANNYWMTIVEKYNDNNNNNNNNNLQILTELCPIDYCCNDEKGCNYFQNIYNDSYTGSKLCANNRNHSEFLCGKCLDGYSEVFGTTNCQKCDRNYWERLLIPIVYGLIWSIFILCTKSTKLFVNKNKINKLESETTTYTTNEFYNNNNNNNNNATELTRKEYINCLEIMLTKIMLYYYQSVSYVLITSGIHVFLAGFAYLFNLNIFSLIGGSENGKGICLLYNMNVPQKIVFELTTTATIIIFLIISYLVSLCSINVCSCFKRKPNFPQSFIKAMLICIGQILTVLFLLLACRNIGNNNVHFYFGSYQCIGTIWILSMISLCVLIILFLCLMIFIYFKRKTSEYDNDNNDINNNKWYIPIIWCYNDNYWYWEGFLFIRRVILALIFIVFDDDKPKICIAIVLIMYLFVHINS
eukprot:112660_1